MLSITTLSVEMSTDGCINSVLPGMLILIDFMLTEAKGKKRLINLFSLLSQRKGLGEDFKRNIAYIYHCIPCRYC